MKNLARQQDDQARALLPLPTIEAVSKAALQWRDLVRCSTAEACCCIPFDLALRIRVLPLEISRGLGGRFLTVLSEGALGAQEVQELCFASGMEVLHEQVECRDLLCAIEAAYRHREKLSLRVQATEQISHGQCRMAPPQLHSDAPLPQLLESIIYRAWYLSASDVHLEPVCDGFRLRFRIDGRLQPERDFLITPALGLDLIRRIKVLAGVDTTRSREAQEGSFTWTAASRELRIRVSFVPARLGQKAVLRLLDNSDEILSSPLRVGVPPLDGLGLTEEQRGILLAHLGANSGSVILSGPTGSGKSTLLYAALRHLNCDWRNMVSLEDPVERLIDGMTQIEIGKHDTQGFSTLLKAVLRQDPDVVMIGEIRDFETAETALTAALTGHLVLSTVHAGSCFEILARLQQLGISDRLMALGVRLLSSQRLLPLNCPRCECIVDVGGMFRQLFRLSEDQSFVASRGCVECRESGIRGRAGVFEFLQMSPAIRELMLSPAAGIDGKFWAQLRTLAEDQGFCPIAVHVRNLLLTGKISPHTALLGLGMAPELFGVSTKAK